MTSFAGVNIVDVEEEAADYGRWLILGAPGSGKSSLASTVATMGKTLFIDLPGEKGTQSFKNAPYAKNIDVVRPESVTALDDIFWSLDKGGHGYKAVIIDSLTALQKMTMRYLTGFSETAVRDDQAGHRPRRPTHLGAGARHHDRHRGLLVRPRRRQPFRADACRHDRPGQDG